MSRFSVYANPSGTGYLLDVQADSMSHFNTRMIIPLMPLDDSPKPAKTLNPIFDIGGARFAMVTQYMAAYPVKDLKDPVFRAENRHAEVVAAIDLLFQGF